MTDGLASELATAEAMARSAATGDEVAFARLVAEHHATMSRVAFVICGDREAARDAVQAAWVSAWRRLGSLRDPRQVRPWLVAIAVNEARQVRRRRRRQPVTDISNAVAIDAGGDPIEAVELMDLRRVLDGVKPDDAALLAMRFTAGLDSATIASHLGMSASGVRSRLARLLERLRDDLALETETDT
jgi:RNA polymerase sigma-70 factor (ECF subfamily)